MRNNVLEQFEGLGKDASYHYAGDMSEFSAGVALERQALKLFDTHPELQKDMREIAKGFLWSLSISRPESRDN